MRLKLRSSVDLPQPDGPMIAVTRQVSIERSTSRTAAMSPKKALSLCAARHTVATDSAALVARAAGWKSRRGTTAARLAASSTDSGCSDRESTGDSFSIEISMVSVNRGAEPRSRGQACGNTYHEHDTDQNQRARPCL